MKNTTSPLTIVMIGLQGSGKGTQAQRLADMYGFEMLDMGSHVRARVKSGKISDEDRKLTQDGKLISDNTIIKIANDVLSKIKNGVGLVVDGHPRTIRQADALLESFEKMGRINNYKVIDLLISKETAVDRVSTRWMCKNCDKILTADDKACSCGGELEQRKDDKPEIIENRIKFVSKDLDAIKSYFKDKGTLIEVDGERSVEEIFSDIEAKLGLV